MKKITTILLTSMTLLMAIDTTKALTLEVVKKRDVLQENQVLLSVKVKDGNASYGYMWREGNRTLGDSNPLKASFSH